MRSYSARADKVALIELVCKPEIGVNRVGLSFIAEVGRKIF